MDTNGTNGWQDTTTGQQLQKQLNNEDVRVGWKSTKKQHNILDMIMYLH